MAHDVPFFFQGTQEIVTGASLQAQAAAQALCGRVTVAQRYGFQQLQPAPQSEQSRRIPLPLIAKSANAIRAIHFPSSSFRYHAQNKEPKEREQRGGTLFQLF
jgi:hypothetical protein